MGEQESLEKLPDSWTWVVLEDLITGGIQNGLYLPKSSYGSGTPILRIDDFQDDFSRDAQQLQKVSAQKDEVEKYGLQECDLIINRVNSPSHLGKCLVITTKHLPALFESNMMRLRLSKQVCVPFVAFYLRSVGGKSRLIENAKWAVNQASINQKDVGSTSIPLPPSEEQYRIVNKIEELFTQLDAGVDLLKKLKLKLKRYRQAVLKVAVEGKLTQDWRAAHQDELEPASVLLDRILKERREKWEADQLAKMEAKGKVPKDDKWKLKYKEPAAPDTAELSELPKSWYWIRVKQLGDVKLGRQRAPKHHTGEHMRPYLRVANVFEDRIDTSSVLEMNFTPEEFNTYQLIDGDILLNEGQSLELVGRSAIYKNEIPGACFQNTLVRFRPYHQIGSRFPQIVFLSYLYTGRFQKIAKWTTNIAHLGASRFAEMDFPLPSLDEQQKIIEEIEFIESFITKIDSIVDQNLRRSEKLRQSILKKAFEGKLVSQDPNDEPASLLLERIQTEKAQQEAKSKKRKTTTKKKKSRKTTKTKQLEITNASNEEQAS